MHTEGIVPVYPASERSRRACCATSCTQSRPAMRSVPDPLPGALRAPNACRQGRRRARRPPAALARRSRGRARAPGARGAAAHAARAAAAQAASSSARAGAGAAGRPGDLRRAFLDGLPFALTDAPARRARRDRRRPRARTTPMRRLLQGDVGSGKTVVALLLPAARRREAASRGRSWRPPRRSPRSTLETAARAASARSSPASCSPAVADGGRAARGARRASRRARRASSSARTPCIQGDVELRRPRAGRRRRAAPLRRRAARRAGAARGRRRRRAARAAHDGDADPAHAGAHRLRRPRRDRRSPASPAGRQPVVTRLVDEGQRDGRLRVRAQAARPGPPGLRRLPADRRVRVASQPAAAVAEAERLQAGAVPRLARRAWCTASSRPPSATR